jgi:hypothetical protein
MPSPRNYSSIFRELDDESVLLSVVLRPATRDLAVIVVHMTEPRERLIINQSIPSDQEINHPTVD